MKHVRALVAWIVVAPSPAGAQALAVYGDRGVAERVASSAERVVDFVGIGDSNQIFAGTGWDEGWHEALGSYTVMWATGVLSPQQNNGSGYGTGYRYGAGGHAALSDSGGPASLEGLVDDGLGSVHEYGYLGSGSADAAQFCGVGLEPGEDGLGTGANLRFDFHYGTFDTGAGSFRAGVRVADGQAGWEVLETSGVISTFSGSPGLAVASLSLAAGHRPFAVGAGPIVPTVGDAFGPFAIGYVRAINEDRERGYSYSTQVYMGGRSFRDMGEALQGVSDAYLSYFYRVLRDEQVGRGVEPSVVFTINGGLNDRNESLPSVGPLGIEDGNSAEAYADNLNAMLNRIEEGWVLAGGDVSEVGFLLVPSHPQSFPSNGAEAPLVAYREAARGLADARERVLVVDMSRFIDSTEMWERRYYDNFGRPHLMAVGYRELAGEMLRRVVASVCEVDTNVDGSVDFFDVLGYLDLFDYGTMRADLDGDGVLGPSDFTAFLAAYGDGCG